MFTQPTPRAQKSVFNIHLLNQESTANIMTQSGRMREIICATIVCGDAKASAKQYSAALGFEVVESGAISASLATSWGAERMSGAPYILLAPPSGAASYLRFIESDLVTPPQPYLTAGWNALEFTVESADAAMESLLANGFTQLGAAEDLGFSDGALRAGQVLGPNGEVLYVTQINRQIDNFVLPHTKHLVDKMFIVILGSADVEETTQYYMDAHNAEKKDVFEAPVEFIADFHQIDRDTAFYVGTVELDPEHYIELDGMPTETTTMRPVADGAMPGGVAMMTFSTDTLDGHQSDARGGLTAEASKVYSGKSSLVVQGTQGEWIELIEA